MSELTVILFSLLLQDAGNNDTAIKMLSIQSTVKCATQRKPYNSNAAGIIIKKSFSLLNFYCQ